MPTGFTIKQKEALVYLTVPAFEATGLVKHAFTTKIGGVSSSPYASLNMALHVGDSRQKVITNRKLVCQMLGADMERLSAGEQIHGCRVAHLDSSMAGRGAYAYGDSLQSTDALATNEPNLLLSSYYADCLSLLFLDPVRGIIALSHAGWQGTAQSIGPKTLNFMIKRYNCQIKNILVAIGPGIGACCYEVDFPVMEKIKKCLNGTAVPSIAVREGHWRLDLAEVNKILLLKAGVLPEHITTAGLCTSCRSDLFYSYRRDRGHTGRMASLMMLVG